MSELPRLSRLVWIRMKKCWYGRNCEFRRVFPEKSRRTTDRRVADFESRLETDTRRNHAKNSRNQSKGWRG